MGAAELVESTGDFGAAGVDWMVDWEEVREKGLARWVSLSSAGWLVMVFVIAKPRDCSTHSW